MSKCAKTWLVITAFLLAGCLVAESAPQAASPAKTHIRGSVTNVTASNDQAKQKGQLAVLMIEGAMTKDTMYDKASVKVTAQTVIKKMVGKDRKDAKLEDLKVGAKVEAMFVGPVAESYPVQATAGEILILEAAK